MSRVLVAAACVLMMACGPDAAPPGSVAAVTEAAPRVVPEAAPPAPTAEACIEVELSAWDMAAPLVLVEEAGGRVTDFAGRRLIDSGTLIATNGRLHDVILEEVTRAG